MVDLDSFKYSGANITGVSLIDINSRVMTEVKSKLTTSFPGYDDPYSPFYKGPQEISVCLLYVSSYRIWHQCVMTQTMSGTFELRKTKYTSILFWILDGKSVYISLPDGASAHLRQCTLAGGGTQRDTGQQKKAEL